MKLLVLEPETSLFLLSCFCLASSQSPTRESRILHSSDSNDATTHHYRTNSDNTRLNPTSPAPTIIGVQFSPTVNATIGRKNDNEATRNTTTPLLPFWLILTFSETKPPENDTPEVPINLNNTILNEITTNHLTNYFKASYLNGTVLSLQTTIESFTSLSNRRHLHSRDLQQLHPSNNQIVALIAGTVSLSGSPTVLLVHKIQEGAFIHTALQEFFQSLRDDAKDDAVLMRITSISVSYDPPVAGREGGSSSSGGMVTPVGHSWEYVVIVVAVVTGAVVSLSLGAFCLAKLRRDGRLRRQRDRDSPKKQVELSSKAKKKSLKKRRSKDVENDVRSTSSLDDLSKSELSEMGYSYTYSLDGASVSKRTYYTDDGSLSHVTPYISDVPGMENLDWGSGGAPPSAAACAEGEERRCSDDNSTWSFDKVGVEQTMSVDGEESVEVAGMPVSRSRHREDHHCADDDTLGSALTYDTSARSVATFRPTSTAEDESVFTSSTDGEYLASSLRKIIAEGEPTEEEMMRTISTGEDVSVFTASTDGEYLSASQRKIVYEGDTREKTLEQMRMEERMQIFGEQDHHTESVPRPMDEEMEDCMKTRIVPTRLGEKSPRSPPRSPKHSQRGKPDNTRSLTRTETASTSLVPLTPTSQSTTEQHREYINYKLTPTKNKSDHYNHTPPCSIITTTTTATTTPSPHSHDLNSSWRRRYNSTPPRNISHDNLSSSTHHTRSRSSASPMPRNRSFPSLSSLQTSTTVPPPLPISVTQQHPPPPPPPGRPPSQSFTIVSKTPPIRMTTRKQPQHNTRLSQSTHSSVTPPIGNRRPGKSVESAIRADVPFDEDYADGEI